MGHSNWLGEEFESEVERIFCCRVANNVNALTSAVNQHPIGRCRLDLFLALHDEAGTETDNLDVEVDGAAFHDWERDQKRDAWLKTQGVRAVTRVPARMILDEDGAILALDELILEFPQFFGKKAVADRQKIIDYRRDRYFRYLREKEFERFKASI